MTDNYRAVSFLPFDIKIKYNHIIIDGIYEAIITIVNYDGVEFLETVSTLLNNNKIQISLHIKRQMTSEFLKKLSSVIVTSSSEIKSTNNHQMDNDILSNNKKEAEEIKRKIQVDDEEIFLVETYIRVYANNEKELMNHVKKIVNSLYVSRIIARPCNFRQKEAYISTLPLLATNKLLSKYTESIFAGETLAMLFPFFTKEIFNSEGVILGKANNAICKLSLLSNKNLNYNMCVFGSSGAGKSYFIKLNILRNLYKGINQIIIDPEGEYTQLVKCLGGIVYTLETYNPLYIEESFAANNIEFFKSKIEMVCRYIKDRFDYVVRDEEKSIIRSLYDKYGICETKESLYVSGDKEKIYIKNRYKDSFPTLNELAEKLKLNVKIESNNYINKSTNLICIHIKSKSIDRIKQEMGIFIPKIYELIEPNTLIYFDEIWKCISMGKDKIILEEVYNMFKTLRKNKAGIIAISQDIGDLFYIDGGNFGKSILNNSYTKVFFKLEYSDTEKLNNMILSEELIKNRVFSLERGNAYIKQGNSCFTLEVIANKYEDELIGGDNKNEKGVSSNRQ